MITANEPPVVAQRPALRGAFHLAAAIAAIAGSVLHYSLVAIYILPA